MRQKPRLFYGYIIVAAAFLIMASAVGGNNTFGVYLEPVINEFGWSRAATSGAFSVCLFLGGTLGMLTGRLNDKFGPRFVVTVSGIFFGAGYLLMSRMSEIWQLYVFYGLLCGLGFAGPIVALLSTVARWFDKRRSLMSGIISAGVSFGTIVISPLAGWMISTYGWRTSFIGLAVLSLVFIIVPTQFLKRDPRSMGLLPDGEVEKKTTTPRKIVTGGFTLKEAAATGQFWLLWAAFLCLGMAIFTIVAHIVIHASGIGISRGSAVSMLTAISAFNTLSRLVMGGAGDKIGNRSSLMITVGLMLSAFLWLLLAKDLWSLYVFTALFGFAWGGSFVAMSPLVADLFGLRSHGVIFGVMNASISTGAFFGPILAGFIFDKTGTYTLDFILMAAMTAIALVFVLMVKHSNRATAIDSFKNGVPS